MNKFQEKILFRLFSSHSTLLQLSSNKRLSEYLERMLANIPGVDSVDVCLLDITKPHPNELNSKFFGKLSSKNKQFDLNDFLKVRERIMKNFYIYPIGTASLFFGFIAIKSSDDKKFIYFDSIISNFAISASIILENKFQKLFISQANKKLAVNKKQLEIKVAERTKSLNFSKEKLEKILEQVIQALAITVELSDPYTSGHQYRVAQFSKVIAKNLGMSDKVVQEIYFGALIHDIGKIQVPQEILTYPSHLSHLQIDYIKIHPEAGFKIIEKIDFNEIIYDIVLHHHERLDGSGYPDGLKASDIPLSTRIVSVADVFEAMTSHRPYRPRKTVKAAFQELQNGSGKTYDRKVVDCCIHLITSKQFKMPRYEKLKFK